ncbi:MAG: carboxymuconolactone decarboxylase family protein [Polyangiaceae bacterium]
MEARMKNPAYVLPDALPALMAVGRIVTRPGGLPGITLGLVTLRASQINGCGFCVDMHGRELKNLGETDERLFAVAAWRESPYFDDSERVALELSEAMTRLSDRSDAVPDALWERAAQQFDEQKLAQLILAISTVNMWNRMNVATRQIAGSIKVNH